MEKKEEEIKDEDYPIIACVICKVGKNKEKIFKSCETKEFFCLKCLQKYDLFYLMNKEFYSDFIKKAMQEKGSE